MNTDKLNPTWDAMNELLADLEERRKRVMQGGGPERIAKQHAGGKLTARERIAQLVDPGSFVETEVFVEHTGGGLMEGVEAPGEGVVTGFGRVNGRQVFIFSQDFTVMGGSLGKMHAQKICKVMDLAVKTGRPIIGLNDSAGARIQEGVDSLSGYGEVFRRNAVYSGAVPQISAIMGPCAGGAVYSPALTDFTLMVQGTAYMFITGPDVIKAVTKEDVTFEELGGADVHAKRSGVAQWICSDDAECLATIRQILSYLPDSARTPPPTVETHDPWDRESPELLSIVHPDQRRTYPMVEVVRAVVDSGEFLEVHEHFAKNVIVGFARLGGASVGVVANNPKYLAGTLTIDASDKAARFIRTCDCFGVPLVTFVDVAGFLPGVNQEHGGIIRHGAKMLYAYSEASVPKVTVVVRKSYGGAYLAMCSKDLGADVVLAWPTAATAVMGAEGAAGIIYRKELQRSSDPEATRRELIDRYRREFDNPWLAAARGYIDDVIDPVKTRPALISALRALTGKVEQRPFKRHGNIPL